MVACGDDECAEDVVGAVVGYGLAVDIGLPVGCVEDFGEESQSGAVGVAVVGEPVGRLRVFVDEGDGFAAVARCGVDVDLELGLVDDGGGGWVEIVEGEDFVVRIVDEADLLDEPAVAEGRGSPYGQGLSVSKVAQEVAAVEHIEYGVGAVDGEQGQRADVASDGDLAAVDVVVEFLAAEIEVDEVLVATQLGGTVSPDLVVESRGARVVEGVDREVVDAIVAVAVGVGDLVDQLFGGSGVEGDAFGSDEVVVVEVAAVDLPEVDDAEETDGGDEDALFLDFVVDEKPDGGEGESDEEQRAPGVAEEEGASFFDQKVLEHGPLVAELGLVLLVADADEG